MTQERSLSLARKVVGAFFWLAILTFVFHAFAFSLVIPHMLGEKPETLYHPSLFVASFVFELIGFVFWIVFYREAKIALKVEDLIQPLKRMSTVLCLIFAAQLLSGSASWLATKGQSLPSFEKTYVIGDQPPNDSKTYKIEYSHFIDFLLPRTEGSATLALALLMYLLSENLRTNRKLRDELNLVV